MCAYLHIQSISSVPYHVACFVMAQIAKGHVVFMHHMGTITA